MNMKIWIFTVIDASLRVSPYLFLKLFIFILFYLLIFRILFYNGVLVSILSVTQVGEDGIRKQLMRWKCNWFKDFLSLMYVIIFVSLFVCHTLYTCNMYSITFLLCVSRMCCTWVSTYLHPSIITLYIYAMYAITLIQKYVYKRKHMYARCTLIYATHIYTTVHNTLYYLLRWRLNTVVWVYFIRRTYIFTHLSHILIHIFIHTYSVYVCLSLSYTHACIHTISLYFSLTHTFN